VRHPYEIIAHSALDLPRAPEDALLKDYRDWLESELKLLGNASHHAYAFGQANMAKRALERLDEQLHRTLYVAVDKAQARRILTAIEAQGQQSTSVRPEFDVLRDALRAALAEPDDAPAL
jgi:hypothetical protein